ncbi:MAG: chromosome partitioning protein ParB [Rickettsiaceae bacterium]|jgi:hypothetical protein|nr:chromosome partitioning protein ParB [Rickettsiaceae bacterium]
MNSLKYIYKSFILCGIVILSSYSYALNIDTIFIKEEKMSSESKIIPKDEATNQKPVNNVHKANNNFSAGDKIFVSLDWLRPTQIRKSSVSVANKLAKSKGINYNDGKSMLSIGEAIPVFKGHDGYLYLIDGHHSVLASIEAKAKTIPVLILDDLSDLEEEKFWEAAVAKNYAYLKDMNGNIHAPPKTFSDLLEDSLKYFASITAFKCQPGQPLNALDYENNIEHPLWIKVGNSVPFIEFIISNELYKNNFKFANQDRLNKEKLNGKIEEARKILQNSSIDEIVFLPYNIIDAKKIIKATCEQSHNAMESNFIEE